MSAGNVRPSKHKVSFDQPNRESNKKKMMISRHQLFILALLLPLVSCADQIYEKCSQNFTNNNILQGYIDRAIYELVANTPSNGYAISTIGDGNNTVYGLTQCRGDIGTQACSDCIVDASQKLQAICPNTAASRIWYELCSVRYDTTNFIGSLDVSDIYGRAAAKEIKDSKEEFNSAQWYLLNSLKVKASSDSSKFGMGKIINVNGNITIYGIAQCTHDLQGLICIQCLEKLTISMLTYCKYHVGCYIRSSSCQLRYEIYNFLFANNIPVYQNSVAPAPAPALAIAPSALV